MQEWTRIQSTADIELLADPFDTWEAFETPQPIPDDWDTAMTERAIAKYGSLEDAEFVAMRDEYEFSSEDDDSF